MRFRYVVGVRHRHRDISERAFAERRFSVFQLLAIIALAATCWFVWQKTSPPAVTSTAPVTGSMPAPPPSQEIVAPEVRPASTPRHSAPQVEPPQSGPAVAPSPATNSTVAILEPVPSTNETASAPVPLPVDPAVADPDFQPYPAVTVLDAQVVMARRGISPGPIDGTMGGQTRAAIRAFQQQYGLPVTSELDAYTRRAMRVSEPPMVKVPVSSDDLARLQPVPDTWLGKSQVGALEYESLVELMAERGRAYQSFIRRANPSVDWQTVTPGTLIEIPNVQLPHFGERASYVRILLGQRALQAFDANDRLLVHFPCSIAQRVEKRPVGELRVSVVVSEPDYTFNPEIFTESEEGRLLGRKLRIPPGPNNPVGLVWIGLDLEGYGIHGTPDPEKVGRTESHGCFRLANWNAQTLYQLAWVGMPVRVEP